MKIEELSWEIDDVITQDKFLEFSKECGLGYIKTDFFYYGIVNWRGESHPKSISKKTFIGHSDFPVTKEISERFDLVFCINKSSECDNTFGIPLGITNDCDDSPIHRIYGNLEIMHTIFKEKIQKNNLSYMNFNIGNYKVERGYLNETFKDEEWVKVGEIDNSVLGRSQFLRDIKSSKFVFCPRGNGIDTHRIWETLYMGSFPIVKYEIAHHLFTDLPILFVKDWKEINKEYLEEKFQEYINKDWNLEKLKFDFWKNFVKNKLKL